MLLMLDLSAQKNVSIFTKNGSVIMGNIEAKDSASKMIKVKIEGGSILAFRFDEIDSIRPSAADPLLSNMAVLGFGLGQSMNAAGRHFQFDIMLGYQFNRRFQAGMGFCFSDIIASYLDARYYFYHKDIFSLGVFTQPGMLLKRTNMDIWNSYYGQYAYFKSFYANTGVSLKLHGNKTRSFSLNAGYQYINEKYGYYDYLGDNVKIFTSLNRYLVQGVFTF
jgi:hypothetical protein